MRVLVAFDKFKDALSADEACHAAAHALRAVRPDWATDCCPLTDGGEGFARILSRAAGGELRPCTVTGPCGEPVAAAFGLVPLHRIPAAARSLLDLPAGLPTDAQIAIVEMAAASGLALVPPARRDPWRTTSRGTGELLRAAADARAAAILLGVGGSATNDLGAGALAALGLEFLSADGTPLHPPVPARWDGIARLAGRITEALPPIRIACDVDNPLLGPCGATAVFGPQKGLLPADRTRLEHAAARLALLLTAHCGQPDTLMDAPGAGAAGGIAFGLMAAARARLLPGFALVAAWLELEARLAAADLVLTGEGRFDASSLSGKGPGGIVARAMALGREAHVFAGSATAPPGFGCEVHAITPPALPLPEALPRTAEFLAAAIRRRFTSPPPHVP